MSLFNTTLNSLLDLVFPVHCVGCNKPKEELCLECISTFRQSDRETAEWIYPLYDYRDPILKKSIWCLKYKNKKGLAKIFAELIYEKLVEELSDLEPLENFRNPIIIPIPLSNQRKRERGYNQTELIVREIDKINTNRKGTGLEFNYNMLEKNRETPHQAHIENRKERLRNLIGSFSFRNNKENIALIKNRNIILVDDITTTGATLNEAKKVLKKSGAKKILAFTLAH